MAVGQQTYCKVNYCEGIRLVDISLIELYILVLSSFSNDPELLEKYQQLDTDLVDTVNRNMENIKEWGDSVRYLGINYNGRNIGFCVIDEDRKILVSFGINMKYRKRDILNTWVETLKDYFNGKFNCSLWSKNERAIKFLQKNGMKITKQDELITYLIFE